MDYTTGKIENEITLLPSFLKMFSMYNMCFWYDNEHDDQNNVKIVAILCINAVKKTGLCMKSMNYNYKYIMTSFVLNKVLQHVGMSWKIETHEQLKYDMDKHNPDWIIYGPWYNKYICKKIYGTGFEEYIRSAITDRYNHMCYIDAHEKQKSSCVDDGRSGGTVSPLYSTTEALVSLSATIYFIDCLINA